MEDEGILKKRKWSSLWFLLLHITQVEWRDTSQLFLCEAPKLHIVVTTTTTTITTLHKIYGKVSLRIHWDASINSISWYFINWKGIYVFMKGFEWYICLESTVLLPHSASSITWNNCAIKVFVFTCIEICKSSYEICEENDNKHGCSESKERSNQVQLYFFLDSFIRNASQ